MDYSKNITDIVPCKSFKCKALIRYVRMAKSGKMMPVEHPLITVRDNKAWIGKKLITPLGQMVTARGETVGHEPHWGNCAEHERFKR